MKILLQNNDKQFQLLEQSGKYFITVLSGGVSQFGITIALEKDEATTLISNPKQANQLAARITASPDAFEDRRIRPSINP